MRLLLSLAILALGASCCHAYQPPPGPPGEPCPGDPNADINIPPPQHDGLPGTLWTGPFECWLGPLLHLVILLNGGH
jgi:hypothetical protein